MTFNINKHIQPAAASATVSALLRCRSAGQPSIRHRALPLAISAVLGIGLQTTAVAQAFPAVIELAELDGSNGFVLIGETADDYSGRSVASAGDVNGDGIVDLIVGAPYADLNGNEWVGRSYVVFGSATGLPNPFNLSSLDGSNGFILNGEAAYDVSGFSVAGTGDVNGDGCDDLIVGAFSADPNGIDSGRSYVLFGSVSGLPSPFNLSSLDGSNGLILNGEASFDLFGGSVASAGDVNGDGINDLIVGASRAVANGKANAGRSYVVFGSATGLTSPFNLSSLNGSNGFILNGETAYDRSGLSVAGTGDVNGDGLDDLIIGAPYADTNGKASVGRSYVVFGSATGLPSPFNLSSLNGSNGFVLNGEVALDFSGVSVAGAGDVNGDGIDDLIVGAPSADANGNEWVGRSYVVFGSATGLPNPFNLSSLDGSNGFILNGEAAYDRSGYSVAGGGDVNGDGIDDLIVGTFFAHANGNDRAGRSYVVFGSAASLPNPFDLSSLDGSNGFVLNGEAANDRSGISVASAGDVNGDGTDDLFVGADREDVNGNEDVGHSYVVFGNNRLFFDGFENE